MVQPVGDREMRGRVVGRKDIRASDHAKHGVLIEFAGLDRVGQVHRGDDPLNARFLGVLRKDYALDLRAERRRGDIVFELVHPDVGREKMFVENDPVLAIGGPILGGSKGELAIVGPLPGAGHRRIEPHMLQRGVLQVLQPRGRLAEFDGKRRELQLLLERRDRNRRDLARKPYAASAAADTSATSRAIRSRAERPEERCPR